ncbi:MAG: preprotein translocase subunit SecA [Myxococcales bacterium]|jgi:preprotein translocase subunit SecA|nr:preprotein translocase subunit SecA [Myxococcales bacterium]
MLKLIQKIVGTKNERELKKLQPIVARVNELEPATKALPNEAFPRKTAEWKEQIQKGRSLDDVLPEAFALVREAGLRVLGQRHFDVQLIGGMALHSGRIAEMRTGEGKTLTATLPSYLNALSGRGVHVVTVNDYLAKRDSEWMGRLHNFLGLSVGCIVNSLTDQERQVAYRSDITYGQNNEFGFDYLRDNMKFRLEDYVQRELNFAIVDEVDSILIDEARTPLIISGQSEKSVDRYYQVDRVMPGLMPDQDYVLDEKSRSVALTDEGVSRVEQRLGIQNLYAPDEVELLHHVEQALRAHTIFKRDIDYVVKDGQVLIVDEHTGRTLPGRRWSDGLHQAVEAKEGLVIESETQTLATISFQNYFRMYSKLSGMTGTADTEAEEFAKIYDLDVLVIPTNRPMVRVDHNDVVYKTERSKFKAAADEIEHLHKNGQPVLVGTISVAKSEALSGILNRRGIPHEVLNAKQHAREADIVAQAGRKGAVTIATNMAGRGTDIILGGNPEFLAKKEVGPAPELIAAGGRPTMEELQVHQLALADYKLRLDAALSKSEAACKSEHDEVVNLGGLFILGTERHESRRIDNQLRGRAGRQGDPGASRFYLSLEDDLMRIFGTDRLKGLMEMMGMEDDVPIEHKLLSNSIADAQKKVEGHNFDIRKNLLEYDDVMNQQRRSIYKLRRRVLAAGAGFPLVEYEQDPKNKKKKVRIETTVSWDDARERSLDLIDEVIMSICDAFASSANAASWDLAGLEVALKDQLGISIDLQKASIGSRSNLEEQIWNVAEKNFVSKENLIGADYFRRYEQYVYLSAIDDLWKQHLLAMDHLRQGIGLRGYGHRDPKQEYKKEGYQMFVQMMGSIDTNVVSTLMRSQLDEPSKKEEDAAREAAERAEAMSEFDLSKKRLPKMTTSRGDVAMAASGEDGGAPAPGKQQTVVRKGPKVRPNDPCHCGSGKKYKRCHGPLEGE